VLLCLEARRARGASSNPRADRCRRAVRFPEQIAFHRLLRARSFNYPLKWLTPRAGSLHRDWASSGEPPRADCAECHARGDIPRSADFIKDYYELGRVAWYQKGMTKTMFEGDHERNGEGTRDRADCCSSGVYRNFNLDSGELSAAAFRENGRAARCTINFANVLRFAVSVRPIPKSCVKVLERASTR